MIRNPGSTTNDAIEPTLLSVALHTLLIMAIITMGKQAQTTPPAFKESVMSVEVSLIDNTLSASDMAFLREQPKRDQIDIVGSRNASEVHDDTEQSAETAPIDEDSDTHAKAPHPPPALPKDQAQPQDGLSSARTDDDVKLSETESPQIQSYYGPLDLRTRYLAATRAAISAHWFKQGIPSRGAICRISITQDELGRVADVQVLGPCQNSEAVITAFEDALLRIPELPSEGFEEVRALKMTVNVRI